MMGVETKYYIVYVVSMVFIISVLLCVAVIVVGVFEQDNIKIYKTVPCPECQCECAQPSLNTCANNVLDAKADLRRIELMNELIP